MPTETFTAGDDFTVPGGVFRVTVELEGAAGQVITGGTNDVVEPSGDGGRVVGEIAVTPGETLFIRESQGGASDGQDGGNSIDIRRGGASLSDRIAVAAGGAGGGVSFNSTNGTAGGAGGADVGEDGGDDTGGEGGDGGTQSAGGAGGTDDTDGQDGSIGTGGDGGGDGGGGGAGLYGGGGGAALSNPQGGDPAYGGGGGSNYDDGLDTVIANERGTSSRSYSEGGLVTISYDSVTPDNLEASDVDESSITQSWSPVDGASEYRLYRSLSPGVTTSDTLVETTTDTSAVDTGLLNGRQYHYAVAAVINGSETPLSDEATATTILPAPTGLTVDAVRDTQADVSWTANTTDATGHRIDVREDDSGSWETTGDNIAGNVASATATGLLNGQLYGLRVVALAPDAESTDYAPDVAAGETLTIESGGTHKFEKPHVNSGTVDNAGVMEPNDTQ